MKLRRRENMVISFFFEQKTMDWRRPLNYGIIMDARMHHVEQRLSIRNLLWAARRVPLRAGSNEFEYVHVIISEDK